MLVNFKIKNYRSFCDEVNFSMLAVPNKEYADTNVFCVDEKILKKGENELLKSALIYGANASGKTNILKAMKFMRELVLIDVKAQSAGRIVPVIEVNEPFSFYDFLGGTPTVLEMDFISNGIFYSYGLEIVNKQIIKEVLYKREERLTLVFKRENNKTGAKVTIVGLETRLRPLFNKLFDKLSDKKLFLSIASTLSLPFSQDLECVVDWFRKLTIVTDDDSNGFEVYSQEENRYRDRALRILQNADFGVKSFSVTKNYNPDEVEIRTPYIQNQFGYDSQGEYALDLETAFAVYDKDMQKVGEKKVLLNKDFGFHSDGTYRLMCFLGHILKVLDKGEVLLIDEIDSKLHFLVVDFILGLFNSKEENPNNAQLICTTHNVMLMDRQMRRDQIYFTVKDKYGNSAIDSLIDFKEVKRNELFSKKYLAGFYTRVPGIRRGRHFET